MTITIQAPASKSVSHRAAIAAALAPGTSRITNLLDSDDVHCTLSCLQALGAGVDQGPEGVTIQGCQPGDFVHSSQPIELDVGESGTTCRLLTPIAALGSGQYRIFGRGRMHERPIQELATALESQGTEFTWEGRPGCPPFVLSPGGLPGGEVTITLEQSSQYLSGLLLAGAYARSELVVTVQGRTVLSWPYVALTLQTMQAFGRPVGVETLDNGRWQEVDWTQLTQITPGQTRFRVQPGPYTPGPFQVEGDWSNASYFLAAGLLHPQGVTVTGLDSRSVQGDRRILDILQLMGASPEIGPQGISITPTRLHGVEVDMGSCPDLVPTVAVLASLAQGSTCIRNVAHLRLKESDRAQALATEINRTGAQVDLVADGLDIHPQPLPRGQRIEFCTYADHRLAMSLSLYELAGLEVVLDQPQCVAKSFPRFWQTWSALR